MADKILFIVDSYEPAPSSNGVCVARLWRESAKLQPSHLLAMTPEKEHECYEEDLWVCHYRRKPSSYFNRFFSFAQDSHMVTFLLNKAEEIITRKQITTVVCTYRPVENLICALKLKERYGDKLRVITYYLDNLTEITSRSKLKALVFGFNQKRLIQKAYQAADSTVLLKYYEKTFREALGADSGKLIPVGLPGLLPDEAADGDKLFSEETVNLVYTGSFYGGFREPAKILAFLQEVSKLLPNLRVHLYCWGCDEQIARAKEQMGENLVLHGRVSARQAHRAIQSADALLNVGNDLPNQVPGKLLEYFATGKPIVSFVYRDDDPAAADYEAYGNIFIVKNKGENDPYRCAEFLKKGETLSWETVQSRFQDCRPLYTLQKMTKGDARDV